MADPSKRRPRRVRRPGAPGADPTPQSAPRDGKPVRAAGDEDAAWGDRADSNDEQLRRDVPPHY
jgi:hypothetical protein